MTHKDSDLKRIKELIDIMKENGLDEIEIKHGDDKIHLKRSSGQQQMIAAMPISHQNTPVAGNSNEVAESPASVGETVSELTEIKSPIVGTFYRKPSPDSEPFVSVDSHVNEQMIVCVIEAMKVMNEIKAEVSGTIVEVMVKDGQAIEYGQVLFKVKPD